MVLIPRCGPISPGRCAGDGAGGRDEAECGHRLARPLDGTIRFRKDRGTPTSRAVDC